MSDSLGPHGLHPARLLCPWDSPGKKTGVGSHSLLQGILLTQASKPGLLLCRQILYRLSRQESLHIGNLNTGGPGRPGREALTASVRVHQAPRRPGRTALPSVRRDLGRASRPLP